MYIGGVAGWGGGIINPNLSQLHSQTQGHREGTHQSSDSEGTWVSTK